MNPGCSWSGQICASPAAHHEQRPQPQTVRRDSRGRTLPGAMLRAIEPVAGRDVYLSPCERVVERVGSVVVNVGHAFHHDGSAGLPVEGDLSRSGVPRRHHVPSAVVVRVAVDDDRDHPAIRRREAPTGEGDVTDLVEGVGHGAVTLEALEREKENLEQMVQDLTRKLASKSAEPPPPRGPSDDEEALVDALGNLAPLTWDVVQAADWLQANDAPPDHVRALRIAVRSVETLLDEARARKLLKT